MSGPDEKPYETLERLIASNKRNEAECRKLLRHVRTQLVDRYVLEFVYDEDECREASGQSDYVLCCRVCEGTGVQSVRVYIWELKAPQCYMFQRDTSSRVKPSSHLIQAENQLLHYVHEMKYNDDLRARFHVEHSDHVMFGGIIIGCNKTRVSGGYTKEKGESLFRAANMVRESFFYDRLGIKLWNWDYVLEFLRPRPVLEAGVPVPLQTGAEPLAPEMVVLSAVGGSGRCDEGV